MFFKQRKRKYYHRMDNHGGNDLFCPTNIKISERQISTDNSAKRIFSNMMSDGQSTTKNNFHKLLYDVISKPETNKWICWIPCGSGFLICDRKMFDKEILPRFCERKTMKQFLKKLKKYGYKQLPYIDKVGSFHHEYFWRDIFSFDASISKSFEGDLKKAIKMHPSPIKLLHEVVSDPETNACIHWCSCGACFKITDEQKFAKKYYLYLGRETWLHVSRD